MPRRTGDINGVYRCSEEARADYFVSCDDVLVRKLNKMADLKIRAVGLLEFISREVF